MSYYLKDGELLWPTKEGVYDVQSSLPVGTYTVGQHPIRGFYLTPIANFGITGKIYGKTTKQADRILNTFADRPNTTGVLLNGEKGSGKTMLAKLVSQKGASLGIPTIVINTAFTGDTFNSFIQSINEPCIIIFDEFEKTFDEKEQEATLTLLDGVYPSKKLFILTCNDRYRVNQHMTNRPGRIFYYLEFKGLDLEFIEEYCNDTLIDKSYIQQICRLTMLYTSFNFDMLKALVEDMNRYGESPNEVLEMLNAKPFTDDSTMYNVKLMMDGVEVSNTHVEPSRIRGNPVSRGEMTFYVDENPSSDSCSPDTELELNQNHLKKINPETGEFTYVIEHGNRTSVLVLTREKLGMGYDWKSAY